MAVNPPGYSGIYRHEVGGKYKTAFRDLWLAGEGDRSRTLIGDVSGLFSCALRRSDTPYVQLWVTKIMIATPNILVLETILEIDWDVTYAGVPVPAKG